MKINVFIILLALILSLHSILTQSIPYTNRYPTKRFPLTINLSNRVLISDPNTINSFELSTGWTSGIPNHGVTYETSSNFIPFDTGYLLLFTTGTSFNIYTLSTTYASTLVSNPSSYSHTYSNEQLSLFTLGLNGIVAFINSNFLTFILFNSISESAYKQYSGRAVGRNVHCISLSTSAFGCFYTDNTNQCLMSTFDINLNPIDAERDLRHNGCDNSFSGKLFSISINQFFVCSLKTDNSINCLIGTNNVGVLTFNTNSKLIVSGCSSSFITYGIALFMSDYLVYCSNGNVMIMQQIDISLQLVRTVIKFTETGSTSIVMPSVSKLSMSSAVLFYSDSANALVYTMLISPSCASFTFNALTNGLMPINFINQINNSGYSGVSVILKSTPSIGSIVAMPGELPTDLVTAYTTLSYKVDSTVGTVTVDFIGVNAALFTSSLCTLTITIAKCYVSCFSCNSVGNSMNHDCLACDNANGYYPIVNVLKNCYNDLTIPPNYYFDVNVYRPCVISCAKCRGGSATDCTQCSPGYHWANSNKNSCLNVLPPGHYLDIPSDTYMPCYTSCGTCTQRGTTTQHNCTGCKPSVTYPIDNYPNNCVDNNTKPPNYYFSVNRYKECYASCGSCTGPARIPNTHSCTTCLLGYYPLYTDTTLCYNESTKPSDAYFDAVSKQYKKCSINCLSCSNGSDGVNDNCLSCSGNKYLQYSNCVTTCAGPTFGIEDKCVSTCPNYSIPDAVNHICVICSLTNNQFLYRGRCILPPKPTGTYIANALYNILDDCYASCEECLGKGTKEDMKCTKCIANYFQLEDKTSQCYNVVPDGYFQPNPIGNPAQYYKCYATCKTCTDKAIALVQNCLTCINGYEPHPKQRSNCIKSCDSNVSYWYIDDLNEFHCTNGKQCPEKYPSFVPSTNECALSCKKCTTCTTIPYYTYGTTCVPICPDNSITDSQVNKCQDLSDPNALLESLTRYILTRPSNKVLVSDNMEFQFCNTTSMGMNDCVDAANKMSLSIVDFSKCFNSLTVGHSLPSNNYFYIGVFNIESEYSTPQVEYVVYDALGSKLNLHYCANDFIKVNKSIAIANEPSLLLVDQIRTEYGYNILDQNSTFYKNICSTYTSVYGTDVLLKDRAKYIYPHSPLCEADCYYGPMVYDLVESRIQCICKAKETLDLNTMDEFIGAEYENATLDQPLQFFMCYSLVFNAAIFTNGNIGHYFMLIFFLLQFVLLIWFFVQGRKPLLSYMHSLLLQSVTDSPNGNGNGNGANYVPKSNPPPKNVNDVLNDIRKETDINNNNQRNLCNEYAKIFMTNQNYVEKEDIDIGTQANIENANGNPYYRDRDRDKHNTNHRSTNQEHFGNNNDDSYDENSRKRSLDNDDEYNEENAQTKNTFSTIKKYTRTQYLADIKKAEINEYQLFNERIKKYEDKSFYFIYCYYLKKKHRLLSLILLRSIYEILPYKLTLLILSITFTMFFNAILCHNGYISTLFLNQSRVNIGLCFGFGFCSALFSYFLIRLFEHIMEYRSQFIKLANETNKDKEFYREMHKKVRKLNVKFGFFYFFVVLIQLFMWYFITAFCAVFINTQYTWGIGVIVSLGFTWTIPFLFYLIFSAVLYRGVRWKSMGWYKWGHIGLSF